MPRRGSLISRTSSPRSRWIWSATWKARLGLVCFLGISTGLQRPRDFLDLEELELVAFLDVVVVLQLDTALEAFLDFAHVVLHPLERLELAGVDHHVLAQQAEMRAARDHARGDHATGDCADLGRHEHRADLGRADDFLA